MFWFMIIILMEITALNCFKPTIYNIKGHEEEGLPFYIAGSFVFVRLGRRLFGYVHKQTRPFPQRSVASHSYCTKPQKLGAVCLAV